MRRYALRDDQSVEVMLSEGQDHDLTCAQSLIEAVDPGVLIADKAFDADAFIAALNDRAITPVIPSKSNRKTPRPCDCALYCERDLIERFFQQAQKFPGHRHALRQARQDFPRRRPARLGGHPPQLETRPSVDARPGHV
jgi:transposase